MDHFLKGGRAAVDHPLRLGEGVVYYLQYVQNVNDEGVRA